MAAILITGIRDELRKNDVQGLVSSAQRLHGTRGKVYLLITTPLPRWFHGIINLGENREVNLWAAMT